jgi:hypothetical protein
VIRILRANVICALPCFRSCFVRTTDPLPRHSWRTFQEQRGQSTSDFTVLSDALGRSPFSGFIHSERYRRQEPDIHHGDASPEPGTITERRRSLGLADPFFVAFRAGATAPTQ